MTQRVAAIVLFALTLVHAAPAEIAGEAGQRLEQTGLEQAEEHMNDQSRSWREKFSALARRSLVNLEENAEVAWQRFADRLDLREPQHIASYAGYGNDERLWVSGRLLANEPFGGPMEDDDWWDNLRATYQRWNSREVPGAEIRLSYNGRTKTVTTDGEGYYHASFKRRGPATERDTVIAEYRGDEDEPVTAAHPVYGAPSSAKIMIVSDMDDTVIHTGITDTLVAAQLTFLNNARTRKPLTGVAALYHELHRGPDGRQNNPVFYVSNSAWNMYDLLRDFLELNDLPRGPLLLRDIGLEHVGEGSGDHKIETIRQLFERFPDLPVVLVGDSGQHDADIYAKLALEYPGRVLAIYIRDVDPDEDSAFDARIDGIINDTGDSGVPFLRVADSSFIADHAAGLGLLNSEQVMAVAADSQADHARDTLAEEAAEELAATDDN